MKFVQYKANGRRHFKLARKTGVSEEHFGLVLLPKLQVLMKTGVINKFEFVFRPSFNCQLKTKAAVYHNFITKKITELGT